MQKPRFRILWSQFGFIELQPINIKALDIVRAPLGYSRLVADFWSDGTLRKLKLYRRG